jgi:AraC-like DNA-binding protein
VANFRGGLAGWQQKNVADFIEEHLDEDITLQQVAEVAQLSRYHFARAFKQSFGLPPHRYYMSRRMERAKELLQERTRSVTQVGPPRRAPSPRRSGARWELRLRTIAAPRCEPPGM